MHEKSVSTKANYYTESDPVVVSDYEVIPEL